MRRLMLSLIFTGVISCIAAGASNSHTCNCNCGDRKYYAASVDVHYRGRCEPKRAGQLKFTDGKLFVCTGSEWKALQYVQKSSYGSKSNPGFSCKDIKTKTNGKRDGIYWITLTGKGKSFPVYCDIATGGWTMVFKAVSGVKNVYGAYTSGQTYSENVFAALEVTNRHFAHYKNRIILKWKDFGASEARVVLYKGGKLLKELKFNAVGSDKLNWFSFSRLTQSPWSDLKAQPKNYFAIVGDSVINRRFFINRNYGGCNADAGWMVVTAPGCPWEKHFLPRKNVILYSKNSGYTNWNTYSNVGVADVLVVYLR